MGTIVYFHIGRGGRYHNSGHKTFNGTKNLSEVLSLCDSYDQWSFLAKENQSEIYSMLKKRNLENLLELFEECINNSDFTKFEERTGLQLGEDVYVTGDGNYIVSESDIENGIGVLNWDNDYDTDICQYITDCDEEELLLIANSNEWNHKDLLEEFFDKNCEIQINWSTFNGNYKDLIYEYFNSEIVIENFYNTEKTI
jgi:hypothetical protein